VLLKYEIGVTGERSVAAALGNIERRISQHNSRVSRMTGSARVARPGSAAGEARREAAALQRENDRQLRAGVAAQAKATKAKERDASMAHRAELKRINEQKRARDSLDRQRSRALYSAHQRDTRGTERQAMRAVRERERFAKGTFGTAGRSLAGTVGTIGALGGTALGIAGGFAAAGAIRTQMDERASASRLANQAGDPTLKGTLLTEAQNVKGFTGGEALAGMEEFVTKTGDLGTARQIIGDLGSLALATGSDLGDLGATAGSAFNVLKDQIDDPIERVKQLNALMRTLAQQGSLGAVEIRDLAQDFGKLGAATRAFEGGAPELLRSMGAFAQIAVEKGGADGSADASTAAARLAADMVEPAKKKRFEALLGGKGSLKSKTDPTKLRDPLSIMLDVLDKTGGDIDKTAGLFGLESGKIFKGLSATYGEAEKRKKGSGRQAVTDHFNRFAGAKLSEKDVKNREASRLADPDLKIKEGMKQFNAKIGETLIPAVLRLSDTFGRLLPYAERAAVVFAGLVETFMDNPLAGIGAIIAAKLVADIASAGVGGSVKGAITSAVKAGSGWVEKSMGDKTFAGATGGQLASAGAAGLSLGITAASVILTAGVVNFQKGEADINTAGQALNRAREAAKRGDVEGVLKEQRGVQGQLEQRNRTGMGESILSGAITAAQYGTPLGWAASAIAAPFGGIDSDATAKAITGSSTDVNRDAETKSYETMIKEMDALGVAASKASRMLASLDAGGLNRSNGPSPVKN
jgi:hypothetical protein